MSPTGRFVVVFAEKPMPAAIAHESMKGRTSASFVFRDFVATAANSSVKRRR
jgi:hypothetical protein